MDESHKITPEEAAQWQKEDDEYEERLKASLNSPVLKKLRNQVEQESEEAAQGDENIKITPEEIAQWEKEEAEYEANLKDYLNSPVLKKLHQQVRKESEYEAQGDEDLSIEGD